MKNNSVAAPKEQKKSSTSLIILNKYNGKSQPTTRHNQTMGSNVTRYFPTNSGSFEAAKNSLFNFNFTKKPKVQKEVPKLKLRERNVTVKSEESSDSEEELANRTLEIPPRRSTRAITTTTTLSKSLPPPKKVSFLPGKKPAAEKLIPNPLANIKVERDTHIVKNPKYVPPKSRRRVSSSTSTSSLLDLISPVKKELRTKTVNSTKSPKKQLNRGSDVDENEDVFRPPPSIRRRRSTRIISSSSDEGESPYHHNNETVQQPQDVRSEDVESTEIIPSTPEPSEHGDTDADVENDEEDADMQFKINADEAAFLQLQNSDATGNYVEIRTSIVNNSVLEIKELCDPVVFKEADPGVNVASFGLYKNEVTGYMKIAPKTLKPMSISKNVQIVCWVLKGSVVVRSTQYEVVDGINHLIGKSLTTGACIMVQPYTPYMLENNDPHESAILGYVMISLGENN